MSFFYLIPFLFLLSVIKAEFICKKVFNANSTSNLSEIFIVGQTIYGYSPSFIYIQDTITKKQSYYEKIGFNPLGNIDDVQSTNGEIFVIISDKNLKVWNKTTDSILLNFDESYKIILIHGTSAANSFYYIANDHLKEIDFVTGSLSIISTNQIFAQIKKAEYDKYNKKVLLFLGSEDSYFCIFDFNTKNNTVDKYGLSSPVNSFLINPENHIVSISQNAENKSFIEIIDYISRKKEVFYNETSNNSLSHLRFGNSKSQIFFYVASNQSLYLYDSDLGLILNQFSLKKIIYSLIADYENKKIYLTSYDNNSDLYTIEQYSLNGFKLVRSPLNYKSDFISNNSQFTSMIYIEEYNYLISYDNINTLFLFDLSNTQAQAIKKWTFSSEVTKMLLHDNYTDFCIIGTSDGKIMTINLSNFEIVYNFKLHADRVNDIAIIPNSELLISASDDFFIRVFNFRNGTIYYSNYSEPIKNLSIQDYYSFYDSSSFQNSPKYLVYLSSKMYGLLAFTMNISPLISFSYSFLVGENIPNTMAILNETFFFIYNESYLNIYELEYKDNSFSFYSRNSIYMKQNIAYDLASSTIFLYDPIDEPRIIYQLSYNENHNKTVKLTIDYDANVFYKIPNSNLMVLGYENELRIISNYTSCDCDSGLCGCESPYFLDGKGCVLNCGSNKTQFTYNEVSICKCPEGQTFYEGFCVSSCGNNTFTNISSEFSDICIRCSSSCQSCYSFHENTCSSCNSPYLYLLSYCYEKCPNNYIANESTALCEYQNNTNIGNNTILQEDDSDNIILIVVVPCVVGGVTVCVLIICCILYFKKKKQKEKGQKHMPAPVLSAALQSNIIFDTQLSPQNDNDIILEFKKDKSKIVGEIKRFCKRHPNLVFFQSEKNKTKIILKEKLGVESSKKIYIECYNGEVENDENKKFIKIYKNINAETVGNLLKEVSIMSENSDCFVEIIGLFCSHKERNAKTVDLGLVYNRMQSLNDLLNHPSDETKTNTPDYIPKFWVNLAKRFLEVLIKLHKKNIYHNNLKLENIFTSNDFSTIVLSDLKIGVKLENLNQASQIAIAPENLLEKIISPSEKNDIWAAGVVLFYILLLEKKCVLNIPWITGGKIDEEKIKEYKKKKKNVENSEKFIIKKIENNSTISELSKTEKIGKIGDIVEKFFEINPEKRINLEEAKKELESLE